MTYQLAFKRKFINGSSDFQGIGVRDRDSSLTVDGDQFVVGSKSFVAPTRFYSDVSAGGFYYGDGSKLTNLPIVDDPSKLPLAGGTMIGPIVMSLDPVPLAQTTLTHENIEITSGGPQIASMGFAPTTTTDPKFYLQETDNTMLMSAVEQQFTDPNSNFSVMKAVEIRIQEDGGGKTNINTVLKAEIINENLVDGFMNSVGTGLSTTSDWSGFVARQGFAVGIEDSASIGFLHTEPHNPKVSLVTQSDSATLASASLLVTNPAQLSTFTFTASDRFFKWDAGTSFKIDIDDHHVNRDMAFKVINGASGGTADFQNYEYYLELPNNTAGWSIIISEGSGTDATITNPDGLWFYGYGISGYTQQSTFQLRKWSTTRITLVPSTIFAPGFAWAVSLY